MIRAIIAEDEDSLRREISRKVMGISDVKVEYITNEGKDLLNAILKVKPELAILDIKLPEMTGLEVVKNIRDLLPNTEIIFITSYEEYIKDAVKLYAADYIIKPINYERLFNTIERIKRKFNDSSNIIEVRCGDDIKLINANDIYFIEANRKKTFFYTTYEDFLSNTSLSDVYKLLNKKIFFKTSRSYIVNLYKVYSIKSVNRTSLEISFRNKNKKAYLSKNLYYEFRNRLKDILNQPVEMKAN
ncbi:two component transcriptional regulator, LytTR family [Thermoanaerobacterium thermosaccharolyticum DSM 571]|uniref:Stage 0 sporulation protein A homolog n=1 Tax=Thermoanaerobacterium thermosaccharolyticum (strain ATCC 7956 / DSM 571 / NCIMB 9385 / NCA 3814 / NCTC 13789 / WDCM 00135 / 2032) TaxID=580327 RepID=D9TRM9_THETC|nr:LytTR family DNA-binding domain-containing protein [Thermoanaerobacterium thermosaccharolyticum]ADL69625.1 two component transcriptional regulator, LytTR family [Thermoanaerobacterium thermosaccharolyticum DSM 571]